MFKWANSSHLKHRVCEMNKKTLPLFSFQFLLIEKQTDLFMKHDTRMDINQNTGKHKIQQKHQVDKYVQIIHLTNNRYTDRRTTVMQDRSTELCKLHTGLDVM